MAKIKLSYSGIGQMLRCDYMRDHMEEWAKNTCSKAGEDYEYNLKNTGQRQAAYVSTKNQKAIQDNLNNNTLLKALY